MCQTSFEHYFYNAVGGLVLCYKGLKSNKVINRHFSFFNIAVSTIALNLR